MIDLEGLKVKIVQKTEEAKALGMRAEQLESEKQKILQELLRLDGEVRLLRELTKE